MFCRIEQLGLIIYSSIVLIHLWIRLTIFTVNNIEIVGQSETFQNHCSVESNNWSLTFVIVTKQVSLMRECLLAWFLGVCIDDDWLGHTRHRNGHFEETMLYGVNLFWMRPIAVVPLTQISPSVVVIVTKTSITVNSIIYLDWVFIHSFRKVPDIRGTQQPITLYRLGFVRSLLSVTKTKYHVIAFLFGLDSPVTSTTSIAAFSCDRSCCLLTMTG